MPHEWRSLAQWLGSRTGWPFADPAVRSAIVKAFVDRSPIDWCAARRQAKHPDERALVDGLRRLERLRLGSGACVTERMADPWVWPLAAAVAVAIAQVICVLMLAGPAVAGAPTLVTGSVQLALVVAFSAAGVLLGPAALRDDRGFLLLASFVLSASAFAPPLLGASGPGDRLLSTPLFRGLHPEVFGAAVAWELAVVFPSVRRFTAIDVFARRAATFAWSLAACLFAANLLLAYAPGALPIAALERDHPGNLYWRLYALISLPAVAVILARAHRAPRLERLKVARFAGAVAAGAGPFLLLGVMRSIPAIDAWVGSDAVRTWIDPIVLVSLGALPVLTSIAVLVDRPFDPAQMIQRRTGRRRGWLDDVRECWMRRLRPRRWRDRLTEALDHLRLARGSRELSAVLGRELQYGLGHTAVTIVGTDALPHDSALVPLMSEEAGPIDLPRECEPFLLLPRTDREWLDAQGVGLLAAVRLRDGAIAAVVVVGQPSGADGFHRAERWFIGALVTAAAAAWPVSESAGACEEPADECEACGLVSPAGEPPCCPPAATRLAALPQRLAGTYRVDRRLGAGGMGVVYLGHDERLDRDVALKTLPGLRDGAVPRLRDEAHAMAALNHPAIATIYGVEVWRSTPVLVLEYFAGGTLADALAAGPLPFEDVVRLGIRLADALAHAHARGMLHRDIKPSNIGFTSDRGAKLLDWGLARATERSAGTAAYLPPEALAGARPGVGVDLWGLAAVIREACGNPDRLSPFLDRALARRPFERYRSSHEMAAALRGLLDDGATRATGE